MPLTCHPVLELYVEDTPKVKNMLCKTRSPKISSISDMFCTKTGLRKSPKVLEDRLVNVYPWYMKQATMESVFIKKDRLTSLPYIPDQCSSHFRFVGVDKCNEPYNFNPFEKMFFLHLGITKWLKDCSIESLRYSFLTAPSNIRENTGLVFHQNIGKL